MSNKISSVNSSHLLDNKLEVILSGLNEDLKAAGVVEREVLLAKFNEIVNKFYSTLNSPLLKYKESRVGTFPNFKEINNNFLEVEKDLKIIYKEINSLEAFIVNNFNTLHTQGSALRSRLRRISSDLGDFRLQATDNLGGATYFSDSFQNTDKIDYQDKIYNEPKCSIDIESGAITLPINTGKTKTHSVLETSVGSGSNGSAGNNQELNALLRAELKTITDSNPDTWFEYERVTSDTSNIPLILELKLALDKESITNTISISSTSFATKSYARITRLEVSSDGKAFTDVIDQIPTSVIFGDTKDKVVLLDPSSGKFSGVTKIKIPPGKIKYINIIFQQDDSYIIKTPAGLKYRKAIGLRGIDVIGEVYDAKGEIASVNYESPEEIKKVALIANKLVTPGLTDIKHYLSVDDGHSWNEIQSVEKISKDIKEILNFNLEGIDSITTSTPAVQIRHKALLERVSNGFSTRGGVEKSRESKSDFVNIGAGSQSVTLTERPISSSVNIKNVSFGSVGTNEFHLINGTDIVTNNGFTFAYLPNPPFYRNSILPDQEIIKIGNEVWARVADLSLSGSLDQVYQFDYLNNIIKFGNDTTGKKPSGDIFIGLKREQVSISQDSPRIVNTSFSTDGVATTTKVYRLDPEQTKVGVNLAKGGTVLRTNFKDINSIIIAADPASSFVLEKDYINGAAELSVAGDYSIDYVSGIIYCITPTSESSDTLIDISYSPRVEVSGLTNTSLGLEIAETDYLSLAKKETIVIPLNTRVIKFSNKFIEPRSIRFLTFPGNFKTEVAYKGDGTEFQINLSPADLAGYYSVDYKNGTIYTYDSIVGTLVVEYNATNYYAEYNIAVEIPIDDYTINEEDNLITFTNKYVIKNFSDSLSKNLIRTLFKVDYDYITELQQNPRELEPYFTPLLKDYALTVITGDQL
jgi:hypothetical protein